MSTMKLSGIEMMPGLVKGIGAVVGSSPNCLKRSGESEISTSAETMPVKMVYYTVPDASSARKSTIVAIAAIGFFYILTLFMGLGATVNGVVPPADNNMAAPLLARSFTELLFAIISAIAFATILGTVSGLIVAASGAVAHDLADRYMSFTRSAFSSHKHNGSSPGRSGA